MGPFLGSILGVPNGVDFGVQNGPPSMSLGKDLGVPLENGSILRGSKMGPFWGRFWGSRFGVQNGVHFGGQNRGRFWGPK